LESYLAGMVFEEEQERAGTIQFTGGRSAYKVVDDAS
jgi:hypothetical protein